MPTTPSPTPPPGGSWIKVGLLLLLSPGKEVGEGVWRGGRGGGAAMLGGALTTHALTGRGGIAG